MSVTRGCHTQVRESDGTYYAAVQCAGTVRGPDDAVGDFRWELWHAPLYFVTTSETRRVEQSDPVSAHGAPPEDEPAVAAHLANVSGEERTLEVTIRPAGGERHSTEQRLQPERGRTVRGVAQYADSVDVGVAIDGRRRIDRTRSLSDSDRIAVFLDPDGGGTVHSLQPAALSDFD